MNICEPTQKAVRASTRFSDFDGLRIEWDGPLGRYWTSYDSKAEYKEAIRREKERQAKEQRRNIKKRMSALRSRKREREALRSSPEPIRLGELL
jgi:hypothetical protein